MMRTTVQLSLFAILLLAATTANSQSNYASLSGTVLDPQKKVIPGASLQLTSESTQASRLITSNEQGVFQFTALLPGEYKLTVQAPGMASLSQSVRLEVGQQMTMDVSLNLSSLNTTVIVNTDMANVLRTTDASVGEVVELLRGIR